MEEDNKSKRILFIGHLSKDFVLRRMELAEAAEGLGFEVHVAMPEDESSEKIKKAGYFFHPLSLKLQGKNLFHELASIYQIHRLYKKIQPDIVHQFTVKPVVYGGLVSRFMDSPYLFSSITGLGEVFISKKLQFRFLRQLVTRLYKIAFNNLKSQVIFENESDKQYFLQKKMLHYKQTNIIAGCGIDTDVFTPSPEPDGDIRVIFPSRLMWNKGIKEFVTAAEILKQRGVNAQFILVGEPMGGDGVPMEIINQWHDSGVIHYHGWCDDMLTMYQQSHIVCLPSYREGLPRCLLEAGSCQRAIVTTDVPGCHDIVQNNVNGLLVPVQDAFALADALQQLIDNKKLRHKLASKAREITLQQFTISKVLDETLTLYLNCGLNVRGA